MKTSKALVLFSGGQDSTICVAWALERFNHVETVGFDYGQRHASELAARPRVLAGLRDGFSHWAARLGPDHLLPLDTLKAIGGSALTETMAIEIAMNELIDYARDRGYVVRRANMRDDDITDLVVQ